MEIGNATRMRHRDKINFNPIQCSNNVALLKKKNGDESAQIYWTTKLSFKLSFVSKLSIKLKTSWNWEK